MGWTRAVLSPSYVARLEEDVASLTQDLTLRRIRCDQLEKQNERLKFRAKELEEYRVGERRRLWK